jgi:peroxiredoxin
LEVAQVDPHGRVLGRAGKPFPVPLEGPATVEAGAFVELPRGRFADKLAWEVNEPGRPPRKWQAVGREVISGTSCIKLEGVQQSADWEQPRADRTAWRRRDLVWLTPRLGVAYRVERMVERRDPARREATHRQVTRYELESSLPYPGQLYEDRRREILQTRAFAEMAAPFLVEPAKHGPRPFETVLAKIAVHLENNPPTPYRLAVRQVQRRVEAGRRGESPPVLPAEEAPGRAVGADPGQQAPDFVATNLLTAGQSLRLRSVQGRPVLLVFYNPASAITPDLLRFAQQIAEKHRSKIAVIGLSVADDANVARRQHAELKLSFPILSGKGLRQVYAVEATPKLVVLDAAGVVRAGYLGWGQETPGAIQDELKQSLLKE